MNLDLVLGSRARVRILRALYERDGVSGRKLSARAGVSPSSGKTALDELMAVGLVLQTREGGKYCYEINRSHVVAELLEQLFSLERRYLQKIAARLEPVLKTEKAGPLRAFCVDEANRVSLLVSKPVRSESTLRHRMNQLLWFTFGLKLGKVSHDPSAFEAKGDVWVAPSAFQNLSEKDRTRFLRFFNIRRKRR